MAAVCCALCHLSGEELEILVPFQLFGGVGVEMAHYMVVCECGLMDPRDV